MKIRCVNEWKMKFFAYNKNSSEFPSCIDQISKVNLDLMALVLFSAHIEWAVDSAIDEAQSLVAFM